MVRVNALEAKEALLTSAPDRFFTTSHYDGYPIVLVNMDTINIEELAGLIRGSWILRAPRTLTKNGEATTLSTIHWPGRRTADESAEIKVALLRLRICGPQAEAPLRDIISEVGSGAGWNCVRPCSSGAVNGPLPSNVPGSGPGSR